MRRRFQIGRKMGRAEKIERRINAVQAEFWIQVRMEKREGGGPEPLIGPQKGQAREEKVFLSLALLS